MPETAWGSACQASCVSNSRPHCGIASVTPASRSACQAMAWLEEVMGTPVSASMARAASASLHRGAGDEHRIDWRMLQIVSTPRFTEAGVMRATTPSSCSLKEPNTGTSKPRARM